MNASHRILRASLILALIALPEAAAAGDDSGDAIDGPELKFSGLALKPDIKSYASYTIDLTDDGDIGDDNSFNLGRAYLGMKLKVTDWLSARTTYDISQAKDVGKSGELDEGEVQNSKFQGSMISRLKYAYVDAKIEAISAHVRFGVAHTPWIDWIEHIEDSRYLGKVMLETEYHYPSSDFGVMLIGNISDYVAYHIGVYNGAGYHYLEEDPLKDVIARISIRPAPQVKGLQALQLSLYGRIQLSAPDRAQTHRQYGGAFTYRLGDECKTPHCIKVKGEKLALWFQIFSGQDGHRDAAGVYHLPHSLAYSAGGRFELPAELYVIARLDYFDPDLDTDDDGVYRPLATLGIRLWKGLRVSLAYKANFYEQRKGTNDEHTLGVFMEFHL